MKRIFILGLLFSLAALWLTGCNMPGPEVKCPPGDLVGATLISPIDHATLTSLTPTLLWSFEAVTYPYPMPYPTPSVAYNCSPDRFQVILVQPPFFSNIIGPPYNNVYSGYSWTTPTLQNGKTYAWRVIPIRDGVEGPYSEFHYFSIGSPCTFPNLSAVALLKPEDGSTVEITDPSFQYVTFMDCLPKGYVTEYSQDPTFANKDTIAREGYYGDGLISFQNLENCETYYWRVAAYANSTSSQGPYSDTWSFDIHLPNTICQQMIEIPVQIPEKIPSPPPDPSDFIWEVIRDAKCRLGPASAYMETGYLPMGHMARILGRNEDGTWYKVLDPNGVACWGSIIAFDVPEGWELLEVTRYEPLPTATPTLVPQYNCSQHTDRSSCSKQFPVCIWDPKISVCKNN